MTRLTKRFTATIGGMLAAGWTNSVAWGHPGHGTTGGAEQGSLAGQLQHHVTEPVHAVPLLLSALVCAVIAAWGIARLNNRRLDQANKLS